MPDVPNEATVNTTTFYTQLRKKQDSLVEPLLHNKAPEPKVKRWLNNEERLLLKINDCIKNEKHLVSLDIAQREINAYFKCASSPFFARTPEDKKSLVMRVILDFQMKKEEHTANALQSMFMFSHEDMYRYYDSMLKKLNQYPMHKEECLRSLISSLRHEAKQGWDRDVSWGVTAW